MYEAVRTARGGRLPVYVVLYEDRYETTFGDGEFHYFEAAFLDRPAAEAFVAAQLDAAARSGNKPDERTGIAYHLREVHLLLSDDVVTLATAAADLSPCDHFTHEQVCDDLAARLE